MSFHDECTINTQPINNDITCENKSYFRINNTVYLFKDYNNKHKIIFNLQVLRSSDTRSRCQLRVTRVTELSGCEVFEERVKTFYFIQ